MCFFFFFKQKTAYEMRISDWSSDVCSSDLLKGTEEIIRRLNLITSVPLAHALCDSRIRRRRPAPRIHELLIQPQPANQPPLRPHQPPQHLHAYARYPAHRPEGQVAHLRHGIAIGLEHRRQPAAHQPVEPSERKSVVKG